MRWQIMEIKNAQGHLDKKGRSAPRIKGGSASQGTDGSHNLNRFIETLPGVHTVFSEPVYIVKVAV